MSLADVATGLITVYGNTATVRRATTGTVSGGFGQSTITWVTNGTITIDKQAPFRGQNEIISKDGGRVQRVDNEIYTTLGADVIIGDRLRLEGYSSGDDELEVLGVDQFGPSHLKLKTKIVEGHAGDGT